MEYLKILDLLKKQHPDSGCELNFRTPFELLVAVILSAQCTDKRVNEATEKLFKVYNTPEAFARLTPDELKPYIFSCGFYNNKGKNIISMAQTVENKYDGELPRDLEALTGLAGVGRKTASVLLSVAYGIPAMPVDTHVFRTSRRIGLSDGATVEKVEQDLRDAYPPEEWNALHHALIFHGRYCCYARKPDCEGCSVRDFCKDYNSEKEKK